MATGRVTKKCQSLLVTTFLFTLAISSSTSAAKLGKSTRSRFGIPKSLTSFSLSRAQEQKGKDNQAECRGTEMFMDVPLDHFDFTNNQTFKLRYYTWDMYVLIENRPILFYTGNEGDITLFCNNSGLLWDLAPWFTGAVVFAEHRYYGKSLPFGNDSFKDAAHLKYLSSEQALADYTYVIDQFKKSDTYLAYSPVIAFGGSYGGMLAAWMRLKYPNYISGALAASAPIWMFPGQVACNASYTVITKDFEMSGNCCRQAIRKSWDTLNTMSKTEKGRTGIAQQLRLCSPLKALADVDALKAWLVETWFNLAMVDYPYPTNFLEPLPGNPIKAVCAAFSANVSGSALLSELASALNVYYNYTGQASCFDITKTDSGSLDDFGWAYQECTEMVMPACTNGVTDMFEPQPWDYDAFVKSCQEMFGVTPRPHWAESYYWDKNLTMATNIFFSNGALDPWSTGGVLKNISETVQAFIIPKGAHHLDLRSSTKQDPPGLVHVRAMEKAAITKWIAEHSHKWGSQKHF